MKRFLTALLLALTASAVPASAQYAVPFIQSLSPPSAPPNTAVTLSIYGTGFGSSPRVLVNGQQQTVTSQTDSRLQISLTTPANLITLAVTVVSVESAPSTPAYFFVANPSPGFAFDSAPGSPLGNGQLADQLFTLASGDLNGDGIPDLISGGVTLAANGVQYQGYVQVFFGKGDGSFTLGAGIPIPVLSNALSYTVDSLAIADVNGDGRPDVLIGNNAQLFVALNTGNGTFGVANGYGSGPANLAALAVGDFNNDGLPDVAAACGSSVCVFQNNFGAFVLTRTYSADASVNALATGDFNRDGSLDLAATTAQSVIVLYGQGNGSFAIGTIPDAATPVSAVTGDFNGDGNLDIAVLHASSSLAVLLGNGSGGFQWSPSSALPDSTAVLLAAFDANADGKPDLVAVGTNLSALTGNGDGTFALNAVESYASQSVPKPSGVAFGDWNLDGHPDIAVAATQISVFLQGAYATASPNSLAFGNVNIGSSSAPQSFTMTNIGSVPLALPASVPQFQVTPQSCENPLPPGVSCSISVVFQPTAPNQDEGHVLLSPSVQVIFTGDGQGPFAVLLSNNGNNMESIADTQIGSVSIGFPGSLFNSGTAPLLISSYGIVSNGANPHPSDFRLNWGNCPTSSVPPGTRECVFSISFAPSTASIETAALAVTDNSDNVPGSTQYIYLSAVGLAPANGFLTFSTRTLSFGSLKIGSSSTVQQVTVSNVGQQPVIFSAIAVGGANPSDFQLVSGPGTCTYGAFTLASNATCTIGVLADPTGAGARSAEVTLTDNNNGSANSTQTIALSVTGFAPAPLLDSLSPAGISLSAATPGFPLKLEGANLGPYSVAKLNGTALNASFSGDVLQGVVPAGAIQTAGPQRLTVANPGTPSSNTLFLPIFPSVFAAPAFANAAGSPLGSPSPWQITVADLNGDGKPDMLVTTQASLVLIYLGNGDGAFQETGAFQNGAVYVNQQFIPALPFSTVVGDFNNDGIPDVAVMSIPDSVVLYLGTGGGHFQPVMVDPLTGLPEGIVVGNFPQFGAVGDFNGDGKLDLATANSQGGTVSILLGAGDGTFSYGNTVGTGAYPWGIAAADFNGDNLVDLAVADANANTVSILLGDGSGGFHPQTPVPVGAYPEALTLGDFNGDGNIDLAVADAQANFVSILLGTGSGGFISAANAAVGASPTSVSVGDLNGDGRLDLAVSNSGDNTVSVLLGNGDGTFTATAAASSPGNPAWVSIADWNSDGLPDLAVANQSGSTLSILLSAAKLSIDPASVPFDYIGVKVRSPARTVQIANPGPIAVSISSIAIDGADASDFSETNSCGASIAPGANCSVTLHFQPSVAGVRTATLTFTDSAAGNSQSVALSGVGTSKAVASLSKTALVFPATPVGTASSAQDFTIANEGDAALVISSVSATGDFTERNNCTAALTPRKYCTVAVTFKPTKTGTRPGALTVDDNGVNPVQQVKLSGTGR